jgi:tRNA(His) 5'-end guanylyltransferase
MSNDSLGDRIKSYEDCYRFHLPIRTPVILRIDGKAFHTYTKGLKRPVDENLVEVMNLTAEYLCENVQGTQLAYVQSDEISLLLVNYKSLDSQSWYDNNLQKMVSVSAGLASAKFTEQSHKIFGETRLAIFDSRAFVVPREEVTNHFLWRQQDATRNSVQMLARSLYSHKACENLNNSQLQELIFQKGFNWNDCPTSQKRGRCLIKLTYDWQGFNPKTQETITTQRSGWKVDNEIPIFSQDRRYIDNFVYPLIRVQISPEGKEIVERSDGSI